MKVTALLLSHDGARWLPAVLTGLERSTRLPDRFVAVDTGSTDDSAALVGRALGLDPVVLPVDATFAQAVRAGLAEVPAAGPDEWVWLLHDDANPSPTCLEELAGAAAEAGEEFAIIGPKLCEWPSLRRLLEVGVTISGTGRRETGLESGEYDQGQHDRIHPVLAVNTAGMLVRREVLESVGFDDRLPFMGNDIDFGWRAALAGHHAVVVPQAVMYHVEAAHRGVRSSTVVAHPRRAERAAAITTLLVNGPAALVPWRLVRLFFGGLLRMLGFLLVRAAPEARDELAALAEVYLRPFRILAMRRSRRGKVTVPRQQVRPLLAAAWVPYRHGLDFLSDVAAAVIDVSRESMATRDERGRSWTRRLISSPVPWTALALVAVSLVAHRSLLGGEAVHGGALLNSPDSVAHWWGLWAHAWHGLGTGSTAPAPPYVLVLALAGTLLFGATSSLMWMLFVLVVPLAMLSAHRFTRRVMPGRWAPLWAAVTYSLVPVLSGSVQQGRIGTVAATILLPFVATSALGLTSPASDRRARAIWRTALWAGVLVAFVSPAFFLILLLLPATPYLTGRPADWSRLLAIPATSMLLVLPWLVGTWREPGAWLVEAGRAGAVRVQPEAFELLLGRSGGPGSAPWWMAVGLPLAAVVALIRPDTRRRVSAVWLVVASAAVLLLGMSYARVELPGLVGPIRPWAGFFTLVIQAGFVVAAGIAAAGAIRVASEASFGWRQVVAALAVVSALAAPALGAFWWVTQGERGPLNRDAPASLPTYMSDLSVSNDRSAVLVLRGGNNGAELRYRVLRNGTLRVGDDGVLALTPERTDVTSSIGRLLAGSDQGVAERLGSYGIRYVFAPPPVSPGVSGALDAADGFSGASAPRSSSRAWRVDGKAASSALSPGGGGVHPILLLAQLVAIVAAVVLALPGRRRR